MPSLQIKDLLARRRELVPVIAPLGPARQFRFGQRYRRALANITDQILAHAWAQVGGGSDAALVVTGDNARRIAGLYSEVDLHVISATPDPGFTTQLQQFLQETGIPFSLRAHRLEDFVPAVEPHAAGQVMLLESRWVAGNVGLAHAARQTMVTTWREGVAENLPHMRRAAHERWEEYGDLSYQNEPHLRYCRGGLADLWLARSFATGRLAQGIENELVESETALLDIRDLLSLRTRTNQERLVQNQQDYIARTLGTAGGTLMQKLAAIALGIETEVSKSLDLALSSSARQLFTKALQIVRPMGAVGEVDEGVAIKDGQISLAKKKALKDPTITLRIARAAVSVETTIEAKTVATLREASFPGETWTSEQRDIFLDFIIRPGLTRIWAQLDRENIPAKWFPQWQNIRFLPQKNADHKFTVDLHSVTCAEIFVDLISGRRPSQMPQRENLPDKAVAALTGLFHNIGKDGTNTYVQRSVDKAETILTALGLDPIQKQLVLQLIANQRILPVFALAKSLNPEKVAEASRAIGDSPDLLTALALFAEADAHAKGVEAAKAGRLRAIGDLVHMVAELQTIGSGT
ncbi:MAG: hypothetical protein Q4A71_02235 [Actinomycetaceae bacterium]|nr:hypothetical protein [Actinomycetaceae bacterium]